MDAIISICIFDTVGWTINLKTRTVLETREQRCLESVINLSSFIFVLYKNDQNYIHNKNYEYSLYSVHKMCLGIQLVYFTSSDPLI
jgi:hypothetical protein